MKEQFTTLEKYLVAAIVFAGMAMIINSIFN